MRKFAFTIALLALSTTIGYAQTWNTSGTANLSVQVPVEAAISIDTGSLTTNLTTSGGLFANPFTGTTNFSYKIRTSKSSGTGKVQLYVSTDFNCASGGPCVTTPPSSGDALTYTCTVAAPGSACTGTQTATTVAASATDVATFGADAKSTSTGNSGSVSWSLTNDPKYSTGTYTATVTFTISAS